MKTKLFLRSPSFPQLELESIDASHLEFLRDLKNMNRLRFFHQQEISPEQQQEWYRAYSARPDDWMFVIRHQSVVKACLGFRIYNGAVDVYNLLKHPSAKGGSRFTHNAFDILCAFAADTTGLPLRGRVLSDNPVVLWAQRHGFVVKGESLENGLPFTLIEQDPSRRLAVPLEIERIPSSD